MPKNAPRKSKEEIPKGSPRTGLSANARWLAVGLAMAVGAAGLGLWMVSAPDSDSPAYQRMADGPVLSTASAPDDETATTGTIVYAHNGRATTGPDAGYAGAAACQKCHPDVAKDFHSVAMSHSFGRPTPELVPEAFTSATEFFHSDSRQYFRMENRDGKLFQLSYQKGFDGKPVNQLEAEVHYVLGSGHQAHSFLHHADDGKLYQMPMGWYSSEQSWGMNPGYDRKNHAGFTKRITYDCMFCHAGMPKLEPGMDKYNVVDTAVFPKEHELGPIDCERCHGPGAKHIELAMKEESTDEEISAAIVNPEKLSFEQEMAVCNQCHLDSTSMKLPRMVYVPGREVFSFRPGEDLTTYSVHVDHAPGTGHDDKHEIAGHGYRFRMSKCFTASEEMMTCTTCHNPHRTPQPEKMLSHHINNCLKCHDSGTGLHQNLPIGDRLRHGPACAEELDVRLAAQDNCITCHMPQRRTDDVVHVVMTDHAIIRHLPDRDLLAPLKENHHDYRGRIVLYKPDKLPPDETNYYLGFAHLADEADTERGLLMLSAFLGKYPDHVDALTMRGISLRKMGRTEEAIRDLSRVLELRKDYIPAYVGLADSYEQKKDYKRAAKLFIDALKLRPDVSMLHNGLGVNRYLSGDLDGALAAYKAAAAADKHDSNSRFNMANILRLRGNLGEAIVANREGMAIAPNNFDGGRTMAELLAEAGEWREAFWYAAEMVSLEPAHPEAFQTLEMVAMRAPDEVRPALLKDVATQLPTEAGLLTALIHERSGDQAALVRSLAAVMEAPTSSTVLLIRAAELARRLKNYDQTESLLRRVLEISPGHDGALAELANVFSTKGREEEAELLLRSQLAPPRLPSPGVVNALAWLKATSGNPDIRNGAEAELLARHAIELTGGPNCFLLSTLAAAQAEQSRFDEAARTAEQAVALAKRDGITGPVPMLESQVRTYREKQSKGPVTR